MGNGVIVADTHAWIWSALESSRLSKRAAVAIEEADVVYVASISIWEAAFLHHRGRIDVRVPIDDWLTNAFAKGTFIALPITPAIAIRAAALEQLRDPSDRLIVATALEHHAPLVTKDDRIRKANVVETIW